MIQDKRPKITTVFLDMDGVVSDFVGGVASLYNIPKEQFNLLNGSYDIINFLATSVDKFWGKINDYSNFWAELRHTDEATTILKTLEKLISPKNIFFLTSPSMSPICYKGKAQWIKSKHQSYLQRLILTEHKYLLAKPHTLLIDDSDEKVNAFRAHGGDAILVPRPWNSRYLETQHPEFLNTLIYEIEERFMEE